MDQHNEKYRNADLVVHCFVLFYFQAVKLVFFWTCFTESNNSDKKYNTIK